MLRLLGKRQSINVRKVIWTCAEMGLDPACEDWGSASLPISSEAFLRFNAKGLVPVLIDGDSILTESNTIVRYLAAKHGRRDLLPNDARGRASVEEVMDWQATDLNSAWRTAFLVHVRHKRTAGSDEQVAQSISEWRRLMHIFETRLGDGRNYACGDTFTVADIVMGLSINRWLRMPIEPTPLPLINAYFARLLERPSSKGCIGEDTD